jgi:ribonuclease-3
MEEEPVSVPEEFSDAAPEIVVSQKTDTKGPKSEQAAADEFSLDDISATPREKTREEIIAEAEDAAFAGI